MINFEELPKDLESTPMMFGIKGRYMMLFLWGTSLTILVMISLMIIFFLKRKFGFCFISFIIGILSVSVIYFVLWMKSKPEKYKNISYTGDLVTNSDLKKIV